MIDRATLKSLLIVGDIWISTRNPGDTFIVRQNEPTGDSLVEYLHDTDYGEFPLNLRVIDPKQGWYRKATKLERALK